ncbi:hypothetical protein CANARDRAFT_29415 [[Candida] arabinofermentans NRRL YB-2248]|uniref:Uncharacterized protein n=1 Tax=[Candida] arabinofermentans NRRL YB-2248 TaxID=983967 RepID=A0A1E4SXR0_9ASCO|nr:hypothetical protein CANARDRAFT_29415 [[Candida] arabinofermentans NRRL YB-2248]
MLQKSNRSTVLDLPSAGTWLTRIKDVALKDVDVSTRWFLFSLILFVAFSYRNIFHQTAFYHPLPPINLIKVLNNSDRFLNSTRVYFKEDYDTVKYESIELYRSISKIFELNRNSYMENYKKFALILKPSVLLDNSEISIKFYPLKYNLEERQYVYRNGTFPIIEYKQLFSQKFDGNRNLHDTPYLYFLKVSDYHKKAEDFLNKLVYPLYQANDYPAHTYNLDSLLDYSFIIKSLSLGICFCSFIFLVGVVAVSASNSIFGNRIYSNSKANCAMYVISAVCFILNLIFISTNLILSLILVAKHLNSLGTVSVLMNFIQLFWLFFIAYKSRERFWQIYLKQIARGGYDGGTVFYTSFDEPERDSVFGLNALSSASIKRHFTRNTRVSSMATSRYTANPSHATESESESQSESQSTSQSESQSESDYTRELSKSEVGDYASKLEESASSAEGTQTTITLLTKSPGIQNLQVVSNPTASTSSVSSNSSAEKSERSNNNIHSDTVDGTESAESKSRQSAIDNNKGEEVLATNARTFHEGDLLSHGCSSPSGGFVSGSRFIEETSAMLDNEDQEQIKVTRSEIFGPLTGSTKGQDTA